jgi:hypothetical protein
MDKLPVTSGSLWRRNREEGEIIQLPYSGKIVRLRTVRPDQLLKFGRIPDPLTKLVVDMIYGKTGTDDVDSFLEAQESVEEAREMLESLRVVCTAGLIEPKVVDNPIADDEISIDDIELADRGYIFRLVFVPAEALSTFRYESPSDVEVMANGAADPQPSI